MSAEYKCRCNQPQLHACTVCSLDYKKEQKKQLNENNQTILLPKKSDGIFLLLSMEQMYDCVC